MSPEFRKILGWLCVFVSGFSLLFALVSLPSNGIESKISSNYSSAGSHSYECEGDIQKVASDIAAKDAPQARQFDPKTGTEYLRYRNRIVTVSNSGPTNCLIRVENMDRFNDGGFIFLGPGFTPSSPRGSSGGSSGSGGSGTGVK